MNAILICFAVIVAFIATFVSRLRRPSVVGIDPINHWPREVAPVATKQSTISPRPRPTKNGAASSTPETIVVEPGAVMTQTLPPPFNLEDPQLLYNWLRDAQFLPSTAHLGDPLRGVIGKYTELDRILAQLRHRGILVQLVLPWVKKRLCEIDESRTLEQPTDDSLAIVRPYVSEKLPNPADAT